MPIRPATPNIPDPSATPTAIYANLNSQIGCLARLQIVCLDHKSAAFRLLKLSSALSDIINMFD